MVPVCLKVYIYIFVLFVARPSNQNSMFSCSSKIPFLLESKIYALCLVHKTICRSQTQNKMVLLWATKSNRTMGDCFTS